MAAAPPTESPPAPAAPPAQSPSEGDDWVRVAMEWKRMQQRTMDLVDARLARLADAPPSPAESLPPAPPAESPLSPPAESPLAEASVSQVSTKKRGRTDYERQQRQTWKTLRTSSWKPRMNSKEGRSRAHACDDSFPELYCCKKLGGEFWKVSADEDWEMSEDPAMAVASDPTKYCPACHRKEIGRLRNHKSNNPRWMMLRQMEKQQTEHHTHIEDVD